MTSNDEMTRATVEHLRQNQEALGQMVAQGTMTASEALSAVWMELRRRRDDGGGDMEVLMHAGVIPVLASLNRAL